jgi:3-dehydroquinate synthetase
LVGAFHQPILVVADTALLDTLPEREFRAGYAEVAKYGLLGDAAFFSWLEANWQEIFSGGKFSGSLVREHAIAVCCRGKAGIVARDEHETGERSSRSSCVSRPQKQRSGMKNLGLPRSMRSTPARSRSKS